MSVDSSRDAAVHVIVMSRAPLPGQVKTRLTPPLSEAQARDFHVACLQDVLDAVVAWREQAEGWRTRLHLAITPVGSQAEFANAGVRWPADLNVIEQQGETLGERMHQAIETVLEDAGAGTRVMLIGSDLPLFAPAQLDEAVRAIDRVDVVYGPTVDGGYYLIGVKDSPRALFDVSDWGMDSVLEESLRAARLAHKRVALISTLPDADTVEDFPLIDRYSGYFRLAERRSIRLIRQWLAEGIAD